MPHVSFVVPSYNYGHYLAECLSSIFAQEGSHDLEVIVIDDASTDNTQEILRRFSDPRLRVIRHQTNQGHVVSVNEGLRMARGEFIARIDPDDRYRPNFLSVTLEKFRAFPQVGLVYGDAALINDRGERTAEHCDQVHGGDDFMGNELVKLLGDNFICSATVIARREAWLKTVPAPELAFHDWYFTVMMARENDFYYSQQVLADYRVHSDNHHSKIARDKSEEASIFWLLDKVFSGQEKVESLELEKRKSRQKIYASHDLTQAEKYFGFGMYADARRCYWAALKRWPGSLRHPQWLRRFFATFIGARGYESSKRWLKKFLPSGSQVP